MKIKLELELLKTPDKNRFYSALQFVLSKFVSMSSSTITFDISVEKFSLKDQNLDEKWLDLARANINEVESSRYRKFENTLFSFYSSLQGKNSGWIQGSGLKWSEVWEIPKTELPAGWQLCPDLSQVYSLTLCFLL